MADSDRAAGPGRSPAASARLCRARRGAVGISEGVWAIPDTDFHRAVVDACSRRAVNAGGDIVILITSPDNSPTHDVLEVALAERLAAEAAALASKYAEIAAPSTPDAAADCDPVDRDRTLRELQLEAFQLLCKNVIGLEAVDSVAAQVRRIASNRRG